MGTLVTKKCMIYNGVYNDLKLFAQFVYIYENKIKYFNRESDFKVFSKNAFYEFKIIRKSIKYLKIDEISKQYNSTQKTLFFTKSKTKVLDFCRHLRNAFCHALLEKNQPKNGFLTIEDKRYGKYSCIGYLEYELVKRFMLELINRYESDFKKN